jgi:hypothetical protein
MSKHPSATFWIPLLLTLFGLLLGIGLPALLKSPSPAIIIASSVFAVMLLVLAGVLAYRTHKKGGEARGGHGGGADVSGDNSTAIGGHGGASHDGGASHGLGGGDGGRARVRGNRSVAKGGDGGAG